MGDGIKHLVALSEDSEPNVGTINKPLQAVYSKGSIIIPANDTRAARTIYVTYVEVDTTPPTINVPADIAVAATSSSGATVNFNPAPSAQDPAPASGVQYFSCDHSSGSLFPVGKTIVTCTATDAAGNSGSAQFKVSVLYSFAGFFSPVANNEINVAKAGSAIPVRFRLGGNMGLDIFAAGYPASALSFDNATPVADGIIQDVAAGASGLQYDPIADLYTYVWKTDKSWAGTQRQLQLQLKDGSPLQWATFRFK
jgi:hypothetical protein